MAKHTKNLPQETQSLTIPDETRLKEIMHENLAGLQPEFPVVKIPTGGGTTFEIPTDGEPESEKEITGVVLDHYQARAYWPEAFGGGSNPPECSSLDGITGTVHGECVKCKFNQWNSGKGGRGKACKEMHRLFILQDGSIFPLMLSAPPTSIRNVAVYATKLAGRMRSFADVLTRIKLGTTQNRDGIKYSKLELFNAGDLDEASKAKVKVIASSLKTAMRKRSVEAEEYSNGGESETPF